MWSLHQLDILRKHERLIAVMVKPRVELVVAPKGSDISIREPQRLKGKATLIEFTPAARQPETQFTVDIVFDELGLRSYGEPLLVALSDFGCLANSIIVLFDT